MAKFRLKNFRTEPMTRELAQYFTSLPASPTERPLDRSRVTFLEKKGEAGLFIPFQLATVCWDGKIFRANGQTSSSVLAHLPGEFPEGLLACIAEYEVDDLEGLVLVWRQYDARESSRSALHIYNAYQGIVDDLHGVTPARGKLAIEAIGWQLSTVEKVPVPKGDDVYTMAIHSLYHGFIQWVDTILDGNAPEMKHKAIVAAMYATWSRDETACQGFWHLVSRGGDAYNPDHPATILSMWLSAIKEKKLKVHPGPGQLYQGCLYAWRAFTDGKGIKTIVLNDRIPLHELLD
jgi:hypothetical protein